jgi:hypothetical protein
MPSDDNSENSSKIPKNIILGMLAALIIVASISGIFQVKTNGIPFASDPIYHHTLAVGWLDRDFPMLNEKYFLSGSPYPPAFHLTIALLSKILFLSPLKIMNLFQTIFFPLILLSTFYLVYKQTDPYTALLSICLLLSSFGFLDRNMQVIPQAVDVLLFPIAIYFFMEKRKKEFLITSVFLIYNHGIYSTLLIASLLVFSLKHEVGRVKEFVKIGLYSLPLYLIMSTFFLDSFSPATGLNSPQKELFLNNPFYGIFYLGYLLFITTIVSINFFKKIELSRFETILFFWLMLLLPLFPFFPDRFISYAAQPLAIISGIAFGKILNNDSDKNLFLLIAFLIAIFNISAHFVYVHNDVQLWRINELASIYFDQHVIINTLFGG